MRFTTMRPLMTTEKRRKSTDVMGHKHGDERRKTTSRVLTNPLPLLRQM
jgi:hypothetical protein